MSRRTSESNKAILLKWEREKQLVSEGNGTRDWTPEQQKDILDRGKAYDDNGKAFEGQHMRSAEMHPECQGNPDNIQFLTRAEHLEAHDGDWRNPTNWYFDPVTKEKLDFGDGPIIPCKTIELTESVVVPVIQEKAFSSVENRTAESVKEGPVKEESESVPPKTVPSLYTSEAHKALLASTPKPSQNESGFIRFSKKVARGIAKAGKTAGKFVIEHKGEIAIGLLTVAGVVTKVVDDASNSRSGENSSCGYSVTDDTSYGENTPSDDYSTQVERNYPDTHASPKEYTVSAHGQHYHTKDGVIWKEKEPYCVEKSN